MKLVKALTPSVASVLVSASVSSLGTLTPSVAPVVASASVNSSGTVVETSAAVASVVVVVA